jgi:hypothetical protein
MFFQLLIPATLAAGLCVPVALKGGFHGPLPGARHQSTLAIQVEALVQARNEVLDGGMDPSVSQEAWRVQQERMAEAIQVVAMEVRGTYLEALPILTDAQKAEGQALLKKAHGHLEGMHGRHHDLALGFLKRRLDLTEAQVTAIQAVLANHKSALAAKKNALHQAMTAAVAAAMDPATSQGILDQRFGTVKAAGFALSAEVRGAYLEIVPQLTLEQREAARGLMKDFRTAVDGVRKLALGV